MERIRHVAVPVGLHRSHALAQAHRGGNHLPAHEVLMLITLLFAHAFASSEAVAPDRVVHQVTDPIAGFLVDVVEAEMECSSGMVIAPTTPDGGIEIRELHDGKVQNDEVQVTDKDVQAHLVGGERVILYRDAHGIAVVGAS